MTANKSAKSKPVIFDIAPPGQGKLGDHSNSKPIIIHRPVIKDTVVNDASDIQAPTLTRPKKVVITPLDEVSATVEVATPKPAPEPKPKPAPEPLPEPLPQVAVPSTERQDKQLSPPQAEEALRLSQERAARLQSIIQKEQYFLPINAAEERRSRRMAIIGLLLVIVLALAWYDTALDANLVPNTFNLPHTSFFSVR